MNFRIGWKMPPMAWVSELTEPSDQGRGRCRGRPTGCSGRSGGRRGRSPAPAPWTSTASTAYSEHDGMYRQPVGRPGPGRLVAADQCRPAQAAAGRTGDSTPMPGSGGRPSLVRAVRRPVHGPSRRARQRLAAARRALLRRLLDCSAHGHLQFVEFECGPVAARCAPGRRRSGSPAARSATIARILRRRRLRCTAFPTFRLTAYATSRPVPVGAVEEADRHRAVPAPARGPAQVGERPAGPDRHHPAGPVRAVPSVTPTGAGVPSPGGTGSLPVRPWSTSACGSRASWRACARWVGTSASSIHFLPRPGPRTWASVRQGAPSLGTGHSTYMLGRNAPSALVGARRAPSATTVYRSDPGTRPACTGRRPVPAPAHRHRDAVNRT